MSRTNLFKILLVLQTIGILAYTLLVWQAEGSNLLGVFLRNVAAVSWSGQFNLDFLCYLMISGLWIMWRDRYSRKSVVMGLLAMVLGIVFLAPYLLWLLHKEKGALKQVLVARR